MVMHGRDEHYDDNDYYELLQVSPNATTEVIEVAYRRLARIHHPDIGGDPEVMKRINEAYRILSNPELRMEYDVVRSSHQFSTAGSEDYYQDSGKYQGSTLDASVSQIRPWIRYFARSFDFCLGALGALVVFIAILLLFPSSWYWFSAYGFFEEYSYTSAVVTFVFAILAEAVLLSTWGTTPGKWLLRVNVRSFEGNKLSFSEAMSRSFWAYLKGTAFGIPLVSFVTLIVAYSTLNKQGKTSWDTAGGFTVTHDRIGILRGVVAAIVILSTIMLFAYLSSGY